MRRLANIPSSGSDDTTRNGFTVIEVLIVLALAGLILMIVLLAVPALNRTQRNHFRKIAAEYIAAEMLSYRTQNGTFPLSGPDPADDQRPEFISQLGSGGPSMAFQIRYVDVDEPHEYPYSGGPADPDDTLDEISIQPGHRCNRDPSVGPGDPDYPVEIGPSGHSYYKNFAVWTKLEKGEIFCVDMEN